MEFCRRCGQPAPRIVPEGDNRERSVCGTCGKVQYDNPRIVSGCIVEQGGQLLLCKRAIPPRLGYWTLPAGFLELGESTADGAVRETLEEACARVEVLAPYAYYDVPEFSQMHVFYRARMLAPEFGPSAESTEVRFFDPDALPWDALAFPVVGFALERFTAELPGGAFTVAHGVVKRDPARGYVLTDSSGYQAVQPPSTGSTTPVT